MSDDSTAVGGGWVTQGTAGGTDVVTALQGISRLLSALVKIFSGSYVTGTFTLAAAATTTVIQPGVKANANISLTPTNASAAQLEGSARALYISTVTPGASFVVSTGNSASATGNETFSYLIKNLN